MQTKLSNRQTGLKLLFLVISLGLAGCHSFSGTADESWEPLFNGSDLTGWTVKCKPADPGKEFWTVQDGTIQANSLGAKGHDYVWLLSDQTYSDFVLRLQFQAFRESPGNSGVQIRSRYDDTAGWLDGPQIDINPPGPWRTGMMWDETRQGSGWLYPAVPKGQWVNEGMAPPNLVFHYADDPNPWNTMEIESIGTKIKVHLNGVLIADFDGTGVLDDSTHQKYNVGLDGHIALQIHKGDQLKIRFKDIEIKNLDATETAISHRAQ